MRQLLFIAFVFVFCNCNTSQKIQEDKLYVTKQYIGEFVSYAYRKPQKLIEPHICYITTSMEQVVVLAKRIDYQQGEWLYVRRIYSSISDNMGSYIQYQVESVNTGYYYKLYK